MALGQQAWGRVGTTGEPKAGCQSQVPVSDVGGHDAGWGGCDTGGGVMLGQHDAGGV